MRLNIFVMASKLVKVKGNYPLLLFHHNCVIFLIDIY